MSSKESWIREWKNMRDERAELRRDIQEHLAAIEVAEKALAATDFDWEHLCASVQGEVKE